MKPGFKKVIKAVPLICFGVSIILLITSFFTKDIPENITYTYSNNKIHTHSWHNIFESVTAYLFAAVFLSSVIITIICMIIRIKYKEKTAKVIAVNWISFFACFLIISFSDILVVGLWTDEDYSPVCYKFTDGQHTIVIEERSFLLYGGGTVYQVKNNSEAVVLCSFSTDDGGRNHGNYEIEWYEDHADLTYNTFCTKDSRMTARIDYSD